MGKRVREKERERDKYKKSKRQGDKEKKEKKEGKERKREEDEKWTIKYRIRAEEKRFVRDGREKSEGNDMTK